MDFEIHDFDTSHLDETTALWNAGWHDGHAKVVPAELTRLRTPDDFRRRLAAEPENIRVAVMAGHVIGFYMLKDDEIYQLYVAKDARGTGLAKALLDDGGNKLKQRGHDLVWLACAVGNQRAGRFYEKCGWENVREEAVELETSAGAFSLHCWRFEKALA